MTTQTHYALGENGAIIGEKDVSPEQAESWLDDNDVVEVATEGTLIKMQKELLGMN